MIIPCDVPITQMIFWRQKLGLDCDLFYSQKREREQTYCTGVCVFEPKEDTDDGLERRFPPESTLATRASQWQIPNSAQIPMYTST